VADETPKNTPGPFDVRTIKALVALMTQHDLSEIDLREGTQRLRLRRGAQQTVVSNVAQGPPSTFAPPAGPPPAAPPSAAPSGNNQGGAVQAPAKKLIDIKSQTVGTFYASPNPDAPPFVKVGAKVTPTTVVGLIEAMKLFNEVAAECNGTLVEILADNQQPVEFGQVLMRVDPAG
jgi:acetyl-CoA carboxylase biotin carboxyl carrier protein